jgi:hypothetical protein
MADLPSFIDLHQRRWGADGLFPPTPGGDASRLFVAGRVDGTPERYFETFEGDAVDVDALPPAAWHVEPPAPREREPVADTPRDVAIEAASMAILGALGSWTDYDGRKHSLCGALGGMLRHAGWTRDACAAVVRAWLPAGEPGVNVEHGVRWACRAWDSLPEELSGRGALDAIVGARAAGVIESAALLPFRLGATRDASVAASDADAPRYTRIRRVDLTVEPEPLRYVIEPGTKGNAPLSIAHRHRIEIVARLNSVVMPSDQSVERSIVS